MLRLKGETRGKIGPLWWNRYWTRSYRRLRAAIARRWHRWRHQIEIRPISWGILGEGKGDRSFSGLSRIQRAFSPIFEAPPCGERRMAVD